MAQNPTQTIMRSTLGRARGLHELMNARTVGQRGDHQRGIDMCGARHQIA